MSADDARAAASQFASKYDGLLDKNFVRGLYLAHGQMVREGKVNRRQLDGALEGLIAGNGMTTYASTDLILLANQLQSGGA